MQYFKGIIMAGGTGSRIMPISKSYSKQLMPVYNKPMIYYSITTLMLAGIRRILLVTSPIHADNFKRLLGTGDQFGINIDYLIQEEPNGVPEVFLLAEDFINNENSILILGDNFFHGTNLKEKLYQAQQIKNGAQIFVYPVKDIKPYGTLNFDSDYKPINIVEKPKESKKGYAITGLYFYDNSVVEKAKMLKPSFRGELEISDLNKIYLKEDNLNVKFLGRGMTWLDLGTFDSLLEAGTYVRTIENRQGLRIGCPEEIAWRNKWISDEQLLKLAEKDKKSDYGKYLYNLIKDK